MLWFGIFFTIFLRLGMVPVVGRGFLRLVVVRGGAS